MGVRKLFVTLLLNLIAVPLLFAQQYNTQTAPLYSANSKYLNGTSAGYAPTKGAGLVLNLSSGRVRCGSTMINYAGGTLTMANNTTNYVYLDTASSCAPASNTSGYVSSLISVATVITSGGVITTINDDRVLGMENKTGGALGTVTSFSAGTLSPLFTTSVATSTTTPALSFSLSNFSAHTFFGNNTGSTGAPGAVSIGTADLPALSTTPNGQTCTIGSTCNVNAGAASHSVAINEGAGAAIAGVGPGSTTGQVLQSVASADPAFGDMVDVKIIPAANCPNAVAGSGWSYPTSTFTAACRAGSNNLGGALQAIPSTGANAQFDFELRGDWDTASQPYINIYYGSGSNTSGTVIWTISTGCVDVSTPGAASDDPSFHAESAFATQTMASANKEWYVGAQLTAVTSGNGCKLLSPMIVKLVLSGTAASNINVYKAVMTTPYLPKVQAN